MANMNLKDALERSLLATKEYIDRNKFSGDYNDLENKPCYENITIETGAIIFDGTIKDTDEVIDLNYGTYAVKVLNAPIQKEGLIGRTAKLQRIEEGELTVTISDSDIVNGSVIGIPNMSILFESNAIIVYKDNLDFNGVILNKGTYFLTRETEPSSATGSFAYISYLEYEAEISDLKQLDEKFIPNAIARVENLPYCDTRTTEPAIITYDGDYLSKQIIVLNEMEWQIACFVRIHDSLSFAEESDIAAITIGGSTYISGRVDTLETRKLNEKVTAIKDMYEFEPYLLNVKSDTVLNTSEIGIPTNVGEEVSLSEGLWAYHMAAKQGVEPSSLEEDNGVNAKGLANYYVCEVEYNKTVKGSAKRVDGRDFLTTKKYVDNAIIKDYNGLENRPCYDSYETVEYIYDGNCIGKVFASNDLAVKVSDEVVTFEEFKNATVIFKHRDGSTTTYNMSSEIEENDYYFSDDGLCLGNNDVCIVYEDNVEFKGVTYPQKGIYFYDNNVMEIDNGSNVSAKLMLVGYVCSFSIKRKEFKQLDEKFIPDTIARVENLPGTANSFDVVIPAADIKAAWDQSAKSGTVTVDNLPLKANSTYTIYYNHKWASFIDDEEGKVAVFEAFEDGVGFVEYLVGEYLKITVYENPDDPTKTDIEFYETYGSVNIIGASDYSVDLKFNVFTSVLIDQRCLPNDLVIDNSLTIGNRKTDDPEDIGWMSIAMSGSLASGDWCSVALGDECESTAGCTATFGQKTKAKGTYSFAQGHSSTAEGSGSHAEGENTWAKGSYSHSEGGYTVSTGKYQHVEGRYNIEDTEYKYAHIVGNGDHINRSNAHTLDWNGNAWFQGNVSIGADNKQLATEEYVNNVINENGFSGDYNDLINKPCYDNRVYENIIVEYNGVADGRVECSMPAIACSRAIKVADFTEEQATTYAAVLENGYTITIDNGDGTTSTKTGFGYSPFMNSMYLKDAEVILVTKEFSIEIGHADNYATEPGIYFNISDASIPVKLEITNIASGELKVIETKYLENKPGIKVEEGSVVTASDGIYTVAAGAEIFNDYEKNIASGKYSHAEGSETVATGNSSHAEGDYTKAKGNFSHAEGQYAKATGKSSHAEGDHTEARGNSSHAEGSSTLAIGNNSHAEGYDTESTGYYSHAEGESTVATAPVSHTEGYRTIASGKYQHVQGKCNIEDTAGTYAHIVGNGESYSKRSNAHTLDWDGNAWFAGNITLGTDNNEVATKDYVDDVVANATPVIITEEDINAIIADIDN